MVHATINQRRILATISVAIIGVCNGSYVSWIKQWNKMTDLIWILDYIAIGQTAQLIRPGAEPKKLQ